MPEKHLLTFGANSIDLRRGGDILKLVRPKFFQPGIEATENLAVDIVRNIDCAGRCQLFQPRCDIDAVAKNITVGIDDDLAEIYANAKLHAGQFRHAFIALGHGFLNFRGAFDRIHGAGKFHQHAVTRGLDDAPTKLPSLGSISSLRCLSAAPGCRLHRRP